MANELVLVESWGSTFTVRVKIALAEKGIEYESKTEDLSNKSAFLLEVNPVNKKVPVLIHKGKPICESLIIVQYIDEVWNNKSPLLPSDPYQRAQARFWADFVDQKVYNQGRAMMMAKGDSREAAKKELIGCYKLLEGELGDKPYFGGERLGFVDVALIPFYTWFYSLEKLCGLNMAEECPKIIAWAHRCLEKPSVSKSIPDKYKIYEFFINNMSKMAGAK